ncbi:MAG TPA: C4-type zinc ribbon domain-containing protein [Mycobacteriales bacterium]|nr:C4-type zinc ribbon domain-containing protein [Mycobacteriales bacterium]
MNADPAAQRRLLDLQAVYTSLTQLAHRRRSLPELAEIARCDERLSALSDDVVRVDTEVNDLAREQRRLEHDVDQVRQRAERDKQRMDAGAVGSPKELESLQHEVQSLGRRQSDLEDQVLDLMERREQTEGRLAAIQAEVEKIDAERAAAAGTRDTTWTRIDAEVAISTMARAAIAAELPADLLALYERCREHSGGVGAAMLRGTRCEGCRLELSPSELSRVRAAPADAVLRCEECRRILVRTAESGL